LPKPKPAPYNLRIANQTTKKLMGFIPNLKIYVHNIFYVIVMHANAMKFIHMDVHP